MNLCDLDWQPVEPEEEYAAYRAKGKRGAIYTLVRNKYHRHQLFALSPTMRALPGWYSDREYKETSKIKRLC